MRARLPALARTAHILPSLKAHGERHFTDTDAQGAVDEERLVLRLQLRHSQRGQRGPGRHGTGEARQHVSSARVRMNVLPKLYRMNTPKPLVWVCVFSFGQL